MNVANPYLNRGNLHFKPICARLGRGVLWSSTSLQRNAHTNNWRGRVIHFASKAALFIGASTCIPIALIEAISLFIISGIGLLINNFLFSNRNEFFQKYSLMSLSYSVHSLAVAVALFVLGLKNPNLRFFTPNVLGDHALHLGSAAFSQGLIGGIIDQRVNRNAQETIQRTQNLIRDGHPDMLNDVINQLQIDFNLNLRERMGAVPHLEDFLNRHPQDRQFVQNFDLRNIIESPAYRQRAAEFVQRFLADMQLVRPGAVGANALRIELNQNTPEEIAYQNRLSHLLKSALLEIYRTPALSHCLDRDGDLGTDLLEMRDAGTFTPLTVYTQYKELSEPIQCPERFSGNLLPFNPRRAELTAAQNALNGLNDDEKRGLVQKILRGADVVAEPRVQAVFLAINKLAAPLMQGPLITKVAIDLRNIERGEQPMDAANLFQKAYREAIAEIGAV